MISRRDFLQAAGLGLPIAFSSLAKELHADIVILGGGVGGCAAALAALESGCRVILVEETGWIGGQLTQQGVPPDEHSWIEQFGATRLYRDFRQSVRAYYGRHYPLRAMARQAEYFNPGSCGVSRICHEPRAALAVLEAMMAPYRSRGLLRILLHAEPIDASVMHDRVESVRVRNHVNGDIMELEAPFFLDATENGALLPLTGTEYVTGAEGRGETGELHAGERANPVNMQAATWCFAIDYREGEEHTIERPAMYDFWRSHVPEVSPPWPGPLLSLTYTHPVTLEPQPAAFDPRPGAETRFFNLWSYRRLIDPANFESGTYAGGISLVNWPQNDYMLGNLFEVEQSVATRHWEEARQLSLSLLYWLQTEVPREDGGVGWPGLRLRGDVMGTADGLAKRPYLRESRRMRTRFTVLEEHIGREMRGQQQAASFADSVGIGSYRIDLHPSTGGDNYIDIASLPFEIPLGALLPVRVRNLLPACKNLGVTHITNGCYRLHPVEWNIGEAAGMLAAWCFQEQTEPHAVGESRARLVDFQRALVARGVELRWPASVFE